LQLLLVGELQQVVLTGNTKRSSGRIATSGFN
jgi:hypothetical protein